MKTLPIAPFAFHAQHGSTKPADNLTESTVTGFAACTTDVDEQVRNARDATESLDLDCQGFALLIDAAHAKASTEHPWLRNEEHILNVYYREAEEMALKAMPGATAAIAFNHVRRINRQTDALKKKASPSYMCHADTTAASSLANVRELVADGSFESVAPTQLAKHGAALAKAGRVVVVNLWRLVANFAQTQPTNLALCDMRSIDLQRSGVPYHFLVDGCVGYNYGLNVSDAAEHDWYYFPALTAGEVIAFKAYESDGPSWCFHAACDDPSAAEGCAPRESVEVRVALIFPPAGG